MASKRPDSFRIALDTLRDELRRGVHAGGARLTANAIALRLILSPTPVREALSRLAGEGLLLERRGQGFFVPALHERDLAVLFRLQRDVIQLALASQTGPLPDLDVVLAVASPTPEDTPTSRHLASERLFRVLVASTSPVLAHHLGRLQDQLAPVRRLEERVIGTNADEVVGLAGALSLRDTAHLQALLNAFFERRILAAPRLAQALEATKNIESI